MPRRPRYAIVAMKLCGPVMANQMAMIDQQSVTQTDHSTEQVDVPGSYGVLLI